MGSLTEETRRRLLKIVGVFFLGEVSGIAPAWAVVLPTRLERQTLASFIDVLVPRDVMSGSATDLQVDKKLWEFSQSSKEFRRLVGLGCQWLNTTGGLSFAELEPEQRNRLVEWMAHSDWNEIPRRFYELLRQATVEIYFSDPSAWNGLAIRQPPQPNGYPPPWQ
jgi:hypothetical protein